MRFQQGKRFSSIKSKGHPADLQPMSRRCWMYSPDENVHDARFRTIFSHFWHIGIRHICMQRIYDRLSGASRPIMRLPSLGSPPAFSRMHVLRQNTSCITACQPSACPYARKHSRPFPHRQCFFYKLILQCSTLCSSTRSSPSLRLVSPQSVRRSCPQALLP